MANVVLPHTFVPNTPARASEVNDNFNAVLNEVNGNIDSSNLANAAVTTPKLQDAAVTSIKISASAVNTAALNDNAVTTAKINDSAITTAKINNNAVTDEKIRSATALSVIGRSTNTSGSVADIAATVDGQVLRRVGTALGFGTLSTEGIGDSQVTAVKLADSAVVTAKLADAGVTTAKIADAAVTNGKLRNSAGVSVIGRNPNSTGAPADIVATNNGDVLRRDNNTLGFGKISDSSVVSGFGLIPQGGIIMWSGAVANIPSGWALCNGSNGTPDLRNRFVVGAGGNYSVGNSGGSGSGTSAQQQNVSSTSGNPSGFSNAVNVANHTLTVAEMPSHNHTTLLGRSFGNDIGTATGSTGGSQPHTHAGSTIANVNHTHSTSFDIRPPYYALAYIMKL